MSPVRCRMLKRTRGPLACAHSSIFSQGQRAVASCSACPSRPPPGAAGMGRHPRATTLQRSVPLITPATRRAPNSRPAAITSPSRMVVTCCLASGASGRASRKGSSIVCPLTRVHHTRLRDGPVSKQLKSQTQSGRRPTAGRHGDKPQKLNWESEPPALHAALNFFQLRALLRVLGGHEHGLASPSH